MAHPKIWKKNNNYGRFCHFPNVVFNNSPHKRKPGQKKKKKNHASLAIPFSLQAKASQKNRGKKIKIKKAYASLFSHFSFSFKLSKLFILHRSHKKGQRRPISLSKASPTALHHKCLSISQRYQPLYYCKLQ